MLYGGYCIIIMIIIFNRVKFREEIFKCVKECLEKEGYSILFGNCEMFVNMCRYGNFVFF